MVVLIMLDSICRPLPEKKKRILVYTYGVQRVCQDQVHYEAAHYSHRRQDSYQLLKAYDVNISGLVSTTIQNEARRLRAERWQENQEGMAEVARFIEMNGSFADENRDW